MPSDRHQKYIDLCKEHHLISKTFSGNGVLKHANALVAFSKEIGATSAIDYGCGKGNQYTKTFRADDGTDQMLEDALGYTVTKYDPAVREFRKLRVQYADLLWSTDVLEHIPEEDISWVVSEFMRLAQKGLFVTVGAYPAKKVLPNGENCHVTIKPVEWWEEKFAPAFARAADADAEWPFKFKMLVG